MSLKALFSKQGRKDRALAKAVAKATNTKIKPDDRRPALYALVDDGSERAIAGLLGRLDFNYVTNTVSDEEEKTYVYESLAAMGPEKVLPPLRSHLHRAKTLSWGLRLLKQLCNREQTWEILQDVLADYDPEYERDPSRKHQLLTSLGEFDHEGVSAAILPFVDDHDETSRFITIEALLRQGNAEVSREPLLRRLIEEEEESIRIKNRIAEGFVELGWVVKGFRGTVEKVLSNEMGGDFVVDGKGRIRRKKGR